MICLALLLAGCALPAKESFRPRAMEVYAEKGKNKLMGSDLRGGISVRFEFVYDDEWEEEEE
jgi:hypothetical protein